MPYEAKQIQDNRIINETYYVTFGLLLKFIPFVKFEIFG